MDDKRLLQALVEVKLLNAEAGEKILKEAATLKKSAEQIIYDRRLVDEEEVAKVKSKILGVPLKRVKPEEITDEILKLISEDTTRTYKVIPLSKTKEMLVVGMINPDNPQAQEALRFIAKQQKLNLGVFLITPTDADLVLRKYSPYATEVQAALRSLKPGKEAPLQRVVKLEEAAVAEEAPIVKIVASTLKEAVNSNASDIHVEPQRDRLRIRFRISGILQEIQSLPIELHHPIISRIKILSELKIDETRIPQDGRFRTLIFGRDIDFRVSTFPTPSGEKAALRVLDPSTGLKSLEDLGLVGRNADLVKTAIQRPFGMILITGPTGSGKTTTLYALMQVLNREDVNIISLEDPVEYSITGINQSQVRPEIGYDFASGLRQILRQDPDVIMIGEVRDNETAALVVHAALTGHIVLTTLHTNNVITVIPRLVDMKTEPFLLPTALNLMLSQRLIGKLCPNCKKAEDPPAQISEIIKKELAKLSPDIRSKYKEPYQIFHAPGCSVCHNRGIVGRIAIFEVLAMTRELSDIISSGITEGKILEEAKRQGMLTLRQDGVLKALDGLVAIEEVIKETAE